MMIKQTIFALMLAVGLGGIILAPVASAASCGVDSSGKPIQTSVLSCDTSKGSTSTEKSGIWGILLLVINILTAGVGVAAVGGILYASILYTTASGNMDQVKRAKVMIVQTVIGLAAYALMFAFLNFLIPGGLFK